MELRQEISPNAISRYDDTGITIADTLYQQSLIVSAKTLIYPWQVTSVHQLLANVWDEVLRLAPKIVILGTGRKQEFPSPLQLSPLYNANISVEIMSTHSACRTYNVLLAEDREVVGALIFSII